MMSHFNDGEKYSSHSSTSLPRFLFGPGLLNARFTELEMAPKADLCLTPSKEKTLLKTVQDRRLCLRTV